MRKILAFDVTFQLLLFIAIVIVIVMVGYIEGLDGPLGLCNNHSKQRKAFSSFGHCWSYCYCYCICKSCNALDSDSCNKQCICQLNSNYYHFLQVCRLQNLNLVAKVMVRVAMLVTMTVVLVSGSWVWNQMQNFDFWVKVGFEMRSSKLQLDI